MAGKDPGIVGLDGASTQGGTCRSSDGYGSVFHSADHVAGSSEGTEADELDCGFGNKVDQGA